MLSHDGKRSPNGDLAGRGSNPRLQTLFSPFSSSTWRAAHGRGLSPEELAAGDAAAAHRAAHRHPEGMREISRGLSAASAATPPETG